MELILLSIIRRSLSTFEGRYLVFSNFIPRKLLLVVIKNIDDNFWGKRMPPLNVIWTREYRFRSIQFKN